MKTSEIHLKAELSGVPSEIQVIPYGHHRTEKGDFVLDDEAMKSIIEDFDLRRNDMVIDYEHQTLKGTEAPAAGWIKKLLNKGKDGIWAVVEWTPKAKQYLKNREYRYLSPVFLKRVSDNKVIRLINAALTNQPAIDGMVPLVNKGTGSCLNPGKEVAMKEVLKEVYDLLGLSEGASDAEAAEALKSEVLALKSQLKDVCGLLGLEADASASEITGTILALKQAEAQVSELSALKSEISNLRSEIARKEAERLVVSAMKEGKVTPAQKDWAMAYAERDPEGFKIFIAKAPVVVPTGEVSTAHNSRDAGVLDEVQKQVNKMLMVDDETFKKFNN